MRTESRLLWVLAPCLLALDFLFLVGASGGQFLPQAGMPGGPGPAPYYTVPVGGQILAWVIQVALKGLVILAMARALNVPVDPGKAYLAAGIGGIPGLVSIFFIDRAMRERGDLGSMGVSLLFLVLSLIVAVVAIAVILRAGFGRALAIYLVTLVVSIVVWVGLSFTIFRLYKPDFRNELRQQAQERALQGAGRTF